MSKPNEQQPSGVPETATQAGDVLFRWSWTEHAVWTERMLTALERGVKGNCWFSLIDKVYSEKNLLARPGTLAAGEKPEQGQRHHPVNPLAGNTINWKAGCGKSACPVWREGGPKPIGPPYPYSGCSRTERCQRSKTFQQELVALLKKHEVEYDERYLRD